ncbi:MAG: isochorismatase family cysteine hydrolase [bacterium]
MNADVLIVVDMLNDFVSENGALYVGDTVKKVIPQIQKKIAKYRENNTPVIYICDWHEKDDPEFQMFPSHAVEDTWGAEIHKDLHPAANDTIVKKRRYSGFFGTELDSILKDLGARKIELCGVCTNICIMFTAADARNREYEVIIDRKCIDSFDHAAHEFALKEMERVLGAKII